MQKSSELRCTFQCVFCDASNFFSDFYLEICLKLSGQPCVHARRKSRMSMINFPHNLWSAYGANTSIFAASRRRLVSACISTDKLWLVK